MSRIKQDRVSVRISDMWCGCVVGKAILEQVDLVSVVIVGE